jgi:hypothetical protein
MLNEESLRMKKSANEMQSPIKSAGNKMHMVVNLPKTSKWQSKVATASEYGLEILVKY